MRLKYKTFLLKMSAVLFLAAPAAADESVLYDQAPPKDAVFVRLLADNAKTDFRFNGRVLQRPPGTDTAYAAISAKTLGNSEAGTFYSLLEDRNGNLVSIEEPKDRPNSKVHLFLINADEAPVQLIVPDREIKVVEATAQFEIGSRSVNPVQTPLAVQLADDRTIIDTFDLSLNRGQNITFLVQNGKITVIENRFGPVIEPAG
ncbi:MAG: alginate O-acetyltransferase AlgF [Pseudomonadota bacterium]